MRKVGPFDKRLKERAKQEPFPLPETYAGKVRDTCAALKETNMTENKQKRSYRWLVGRAPASGVCARAWTGSGQAEGSTSALSGTVPSPSARRGSIDGSVDVAARGAAGG